MSTTSEIAPALQTRSLSRLENIFWRLSNSGSLNFTFFSRLRGPLSETIVREALDRVQLNHPLLRVRIEVTPTGPVYCAEGVGRIPLRVMEMPTGANGVDANTVLPEVETEINDAVPWTVGPMVRCVLIKHSPELHYVLLTFHHLISDGMSGLIVLRDFYRTLDEAVQGAIAASPEIPTLQGTAIDDRLPRSARRLRGVLASVLFLLWNRRQDKRLGRSVQIPPVANALSDSLKTCVIMREFTAEFTTQLARRAKAEKTTVHGVLMAAVCMGISSTIGHGQPVSFRLRTPVNLRDELTPIPKDELGLFVSVMFFRRLLTGNEDLWQLARAMRAELVSPQQQRNLWGALRLMPMLYKRLKGETLSDQELVREWCSKASSTCGLTNLGRLEMATTYGSLTLEALNVAASLSSLVDLLSIVLTFEGRMSWTFLCPERVFGPHGTAAADMIDNIVGRVQAAIE